MLKTSTFQFNEQDTEHLESLKKSLNLNSKSDVLRHSLRLLAALKKGQDDGEKIIIETPDGKQKQLVIHYG